MANRLDGYIMAGIAVVMTAAFCFLLFGPWQRRLSGLRASVAGLQEQLVRGTVDITELSEVEVRLEHAADLLADYRTRVPEAAEVGDFVEAVSAAAERFGLRDRNIVPLAAERLGRVTALPFRITFDARFDAVFNFLREVERLPRVARVTELVLVRPKHGDASAGDEEGELNAELTLQVYYEAT